MKSRLALPLLFLASCQGEPRSLDGLAVRGHVFLDGNGDGIFDEDELGIEGISVYLDLDEDGRLDDGEPSALTDAHGAYGLTGLGPGRYQVRQVLPFGYRSEVNANARIAADRDDDAPRIGRNRSTIIGGSDADAQRYPFMVSVGGGRGGRFSQFCGGALLSDQFVATAAHCSEGSEPDEVAVMLGSQVADEGGTVVGVSEIIMHPDWTGVISEGYDMALWRLSERVDLEGLGLRTIDLMKPEEAHLATAGNLATTIGWGVTDNPSDALQEVHVPIADDDLCGEAYPQVQTFETQICAGAPTGGLDSCQGDSGGPLLVRDPQRDRWIHAGITSWGDGCGLAGKPGIYGRTSGMSEWAHEQMLEAPLSYTIEIHDKNASIDFSNQSTRRPMQGKVEDRWALSNIEMLGGDGDRVEAQQNVAFRFSLFDDPSIRQTTGVAPEYTCSLDPDGDGPVTSEEFPCGSGVNQVDFEGYEDGAYLTRIHIASESREGSRTHFVRAGEPTFTETTGSLQLTDDNDPDYNGEYYIDYFELTELEPGVVSIVEIEASFAVQLGLYDGVERTGDGGGTIELSFGPSSDRTRTSLQFSAESGRSYLIGVSSQGERATGDYTLRVVNSGAPVATDL